MNKHIQINEPDDMERLSFLYEKYRYLLFKVANDILKDNYLAEDALHNTFVKVSHQMDKIDDVDSKATMRFLIVITKNTAIDMWRKRKKQNERETGIDDINDDEKPTTEIESDVDNNVMSAFLKLPDTYRDVFLLKYANGYDNKKIAEILGIMESTVRQRIKRGKRILERELEEDGNVK